MASLNKATLIGRLGKDPEARSMSNGGEVVSFSLATSESWKDKDGNRQEKTEWHNVVIFNEGIGKVAKQYLRKGSQCYVEGQLQTRKWQDQNGNDKYTTEIVLQKFRGELVLLDSKPAGSGQSRDNAGGGNADTGSAGQSAWDQHDLDDSDVPFISPFMHHERRVG